MPAPQASQISAKATQTKLPSTVSTGQITDIYETTKRRGSNNDDDTYETTDDVDDDVRGFYEIGSPYLTTDHFSMHSTVSEETAIRL